MDNGFIFGFTFGVGCGLCMGYLLKGRSHSDKSDSTLDENEGVSKISSNLALGDNTSYCQCKYKAVSECRMCISLIVGYNE